MKREMPDDAADRDRGDPQRQQEQAFLVVLTHMDHFLSS
jgi:hypothetical protein